MLNPQNTDFGSHEQFKLVVEDKSENHLIENSSNYVREDTKKQAILDLSIGAELMHFNFDETDENNSEIQSLNKVIKENILIWKNDKGKLPLFNLPNLTTEPLNQSHKKINVMPTKVSFRLPVRTNPIPNIQKNVINDSLAQEKEVDIERQSNKVVPRLYQQVGDPLTAGQRYSIWKTGKFKIQYESNATEEWKTPIYGFQNCIQKLLPDSDDLRCFLNFVKKRIYRQQYLKEFRQDKKLPWLDHPFVRYRKMTILSGFLEILSSLIHLIYLFIGIPIYDVDISQYRSQVFDLMSSKMVSSIFPKNKTMNINLSFLHHLKEESDIYKPFDQFDINENKEVVKVMKLVLRQQIELKLPKDYKQSIRTVLQDIIYDNVIERVKNHLKSKRVRNEIIISFEQTYRSQIAMYRFKQMVYRRKIKPNNFEKVALELLNSAKCPEYYQVLNKIIVEKLNYPNQSYLNETFHKLKKPTYTHKFSFYYLKPRVIQEVQGNGELQFKISLSWDVSISSTFYGWRIVEIFMILAQYFHEFLGVYFSLARWFLKFGIFTEKFSNKFECDQKSGKIKEISSSGQSTATSLYGQTRNFVQKNISRFDEIGCSEIISWICNRVFYYILIQFLYGFLFINITLRVGALSLAIFFSIIAVPLSVAKALIGGTISFCYEKFFVDEIPTRSSNQYWNFFSYLPILNSILPLCFGMLHFAGTLFKLGFRSGLQFLQYLILLFMYITRQTLDLILIAYFICFARIPSNNYWWMWRIENYLTNERITGSYFNFHKPEIFQRYQLSQQQINQLIDSSIGQNIFDYYQQQMILQINKPVENNDTVLKNAEADNSFNKNMFNSVIIKYKKAAEDLQNSLQTQINKSKKALPSIIKMKSQQKYQFAYERNKVMEIARDSEKHLIKKYQDNKLFQGIIWKMYNCSIGDYRELSLEFLNNIFFEGKLAPDLVLEKLTFDVTQEQNLTSILPEVSIDSVDRLLAQEFDIEEEISSPLEFLQVSQFINEVLSAQSNSRMFKISLEQFNYQDLLQINASFLSSQNMQQQQL